MIVIFSGVMVVGDVGKWVFLFNVVEYNLQ